MILDKDVQNTLIYCKKNLDLTFKGDDYFYSCLPLCVIDSIFSINARYGAVLNIITRVCEELSINQKAEKKRTIPGVEEQLSVSEYLMYISQKTDIEVAENLYSNRQRTSPTNGILKSEAVRRFLEVLKKYGIEYYQDIVKIENNESFECDIKLIKGQRSGITLKYFFMLVGNFDLIKPDRMVIRFLESATGKAFNADECQKILTKVSESLGGEYPYMTPRLLDYQIWNYQSKL